MKKELIIASLLILVFLAGCGKKLEVAITDVEEPEEIEEIEEIEKPVCNLDGTCDPEETCECDDCKDTFECRKEALGEDEYLLKIGMSETVAGKTLTFLDLDSDGKTTLKVDDRTWVMEKTKYKEVVNGLEVTVAEAEYDIDKEKIIIKVEAKEYVPGYNEYFFDGTGSEKIIESVRIQLRKVEESTPRNYVLLQVGDALNEKFKEGEPQEMAGLRITLVEANPRGIPRESYAILKVEKA